MNEGPSAFVVTEDLDDIAKFILNSAHIADSTVTTNPDLPDAPRLQEALSSLECDQWNQAILDELAAIKDAGTWELVDPSLHIQNIVGCHFMLQKKCGSNGEVMHFKACLVAQGFSQCKGIDYSETFAPVVKSASLQVFLAICACHGWQIRQMDIKSAYLNGVISEDIYMCQLKGYEEKGEEGKVAKLKKGLYGLKQAGREWYATLHDFLIQLGFTWTHADHSVFVYQWDTSTIIIPVYLDDKLLAGNDDSLLDSVQHSIGTHFKTSDLGTASWILGIRLQHDIAARTLFID